MDLEERNDPLYNALQPLVDQHVSALLDEDGVDNDRASVILAHFSFALAHIITAGFLRNMPDGGEVALPAKVRFSCDQVHALTVEHMRETLRLNDIPDPWAEMPEKSLNEQTFDEIMREINDQEKT
jgi:hypothetical protein